MKELYNSTNENMRVNVLINGEIKLAFFGMYFSLMFSTHVRVVSLRFSASPIKYLAINYYISTVLEAMNL